MLVAPAPSAPSEAEASSVRTVVWGGSSMKGKPYHRLDRNRGAAGLVRHDVTHDTPPQGSNGPVESRSAAAATRSSLAVSAMRTCRAPAGP